MNDDKLSHEIASALEKITPGKWHAPGLGEVHSDHDNGIYAGVAADGENDPVIADGCSDENADFIAKAPDLLRRALAALQQQGWQPIDTHNGSSFGVLIVEDQCVGEANYHGEEHGWWWSGNHPTDAHGRRVYPTHWQPLPALPSSASEPASE